MEKGGPSSGPVIGAPFKVEKVTATSTTSPRTEEERAIQAACDKKRKKRVKTGKDWKSRKTDAGFHRVFEAAREQETSNRLSQELPNCNWLEQKIKQGGNQTTSVKPRKRSSNLFSSDSEEESLVVDELVDGKLDVNVEPTSRKPDHLIEPTSRKPDHLIEPTCRKPESRAEPSSRKPDIRVGPSRKPEHRVEPSRKPESRGGKPVDNHQDLTTSGKFDNHKLVDGKFDNLDERGADEDEKAQEVPDWTKIKEVMNKSLMGAIETQSSSSSSQGEVLLSPPCITIAEEDCQQPIQIRVSIQGEANEFTMDSLDGFQPERDRAEADRKTVEEQKVKAVEHERNTERLKELIRIKSEVEKDIESLRNKKIQEMEELLEIKNKKERSRNELEELRLDVYREKNLLDSLRHQRASKEASLEHLRHVEAARAASSSSLPTSAPPARLMPNAQPVTSSPALASLRSEQATSQCLTSLRSEPTTQRLQSEPGVQGLSSLRSEPPKLAHRLSLEQQQMTARCEARHSLEQQQYKQELASDNHGQNQQHQSHQTQQHALQGEGRLSLEQAQGLSASGADHHHSEARLSLEHAQSLAERALRLEQERRLGHDRKQDQRQEQLRREAAVDSKAAVLHRRFPEVDHARLGRLQGELANVKRCEGGGAGREPGKLVRVDIERPPPPLNIERPSGMNIERPSGMNIERPPGMNIERPPGMNIERPPGMNIERPPPLPPPYGRQTSLPEYPGVGRGAAGLPAMQVMSEMYRQAVEAQSRPGGQHPYLPFPWAAARSANGLPAHPGQAGGGVQAIHGRHGIVDPGPAATHKGRTAVLDPAGGHPGVGASRGRGRAGLHGHLAMGRGRPAPPGGDSQCAACGALANFMCSACKGVHYCSTQCQRGHWEVHSNTCLPPT